METKNCPFCKEEIKIDAIKCKHCGEFIEEKQSKESIKLKPFNYNLSIGLGISNFIVGLLIMLIVEGIETENVYIYGFSLWLIYYFVTIYKFNQYIKNFGITNLSSIIKIGTLSLLVAILSFILYYFEFISTISLILCIISIIVSFLCFIIFSIRFLNNKFDFVGGINIVGLCNLIFISLWLMVSIFKLTINSSDLERFTLILFLFQVPLIGVLYTFFKAKSYSKLNSDLAVHPDTEVISSKPKLKITKLKLIIFSILTVLIIVAAYIIYWGSSTYWMFY